MGGESCILVEANMNLKVNAIEKLVLSEELGISLGEKAKKLTLENF